MELRQRLSVVFVTVATVVVTLIGLSVLAEASGTDVGLAHASDARPTPTTGGWTAPDRSSAGAGTGSDDAGLAVRLEAGERLRSGRDARLRVRVSGEVAEQLRRDGGLARVHLQLEAVPSARGQLWLTQHASVGVLTALEQAPFAVHVGAGAPCDQSPGRVRVEVVPLDPELGRATAVQVLPPVDCVQRAPTLDAPIEGPGAGACLALATDRPLATSQVLPRRCTPRRRAPVVVDTVSPEDASDGEADEAVDDGEDDGQEDGEDGGADPDRGLDDEPEGDGPATGAPEVDGADRAGSGDENRNGAERGQDPDPTEPRDDPGPGDADDPPSPDDPSPPDGTSEPQGDMPVGEPGSGSARSSDPDGDTRAPRPGTVG